MAVLQVLVPILLVVLSSITNAKDLPLTPFAKSVKSALPKSAYDKLFGFKVKDQASFVKGVGAGTESFAKTLGQKTPPELAKQFEAEGKRLAKELTPELVFAIFANAVGKTLQDGQKLTPMNQGRLANKFAEELTKAADSVKADDIVAIGTAIGKANAVFLKSMGLSSQDVLVSFEKNLLAEDKKL